MVDITAPSNVHMKLPWQQQTQASMYSAKALALTRRMQGDAGGSGSNGVRHQIGFNYLCPRSTAGKKLIDEGKLEQFIISAASTCRILL